MPGLGKEDPPIENNAPFSYFQSSAPTVLPPSCPAKSLEPFQSRTIKALHPNLTPDPVQDPVANRMDTLSYPG